MVKGKKIYGIIIVDILALMCIYEFGKYAVIMTMTSEYSRYFKDYDYDHICTLREGILFTLCVATAFLYFTELMVHIKKCIIMFLTALAVATIMTVFFVLLQFFMEYRLFVRPYTLSSYVKSIWLNIDNIMGRTDSYIFYLVCLCTAEFLCIIKYKKEELKRNWFRFFWKARMNLILFNIKIKKKMPQGCIILDTCAENEKQRYEARLVKELNGFKIVHITGEEYRRALDEFLKDGYRSEPFPMWEKFAAAEIIVLDDIDLVCEDDDMLQVMIALFFIAAIESGQRMIITGSDMEGRIYYFQHKMWLECPEGIIIVSEYPNLLHML